MLFCSIKPQENSVEDVLSPYLMHPLECCHLAVFHDVTFVPELMKRLHGVGKEEEGHIY